MAAVGGGERGGGRGGGGGGRGGGRRWGWEAHLLKFKLEVMVAELEEEEKRATSGSRGGAPDWPVAGALQRARWALEEALALLRADYPEAFGR